MGTVPPTCLLFAANQTNSHSAMCGTVVGVATRQRMLSHALGCSLPLSKTVPPLDSGATMRPVLDAALKSLTPVVSDDWPRAPPAVGQTWESRWRHPAPESVTLARRKTPPIRS